MSDDRAEYLIGISSDGDIANKIELDDLVGGFQTTGKRKMLL